MASLQRTFESEIPEQRKRRLNNERQAYYKNRQKTKYQTNTNPIKRQEKIDIERHDLGRMNQICVHCGAKFWIEVKEHHSSKTTPSFARCCAGGKVTLPSLLKPPQYLMDLYTSSSPNAVLFRKNIRGYNNLLA